MTIYPIECYRYAGNNIFVDTVIFPHLPKENWHWVVAYRSTLSKTYLNAIAMNQPTPKELYMMNSGKKMYIYKDGFGDCYEASAEQEFKWQQEVIEQELVKLDTEQNTTILTFAIDNLSYHQYTGLELLLIEKMNAATLKRRIVFATSLWTLYKYRLSLGIILKELELNRAECLQEVFWALNQFHESNLAKKFIISCIAGTDLEIMTRAQLTLVMWSYSGLRRLRENNLLQQLLPSNRCSPAFKAALQRLNRILFDRT